MATGARPTEVARPFCTELTFFHPTEFSKLLSQLVLLFITQRTLGIAAPFLILVLYILQRLYLQTSRQLRCLDIELRAQVLTNFLETVSRPVTCTWTVSVE